MQTVLSYVLIDHTWPYTKFGPSVVGNGIVTTQLDWEKGSNIKTRWYSLKEIVFYCLAFRKCCKQKMVRQNYDGKGDQVLLKKKRNQYNQKRT